MVPTIDINGRVYPVRFSVRAAITCAKERGSVEQVLFGSNDEAENMLNSCYVLHQMLLAGKAWCEQEGEQIETPPIPTLEQLQDRLSFGWLAKNRARIAEIVMDEQRAEIGAEAQDEKN